MKACSALKLSILPFPIIHSPSSVLGLRIQRTLKNTKRWSSEIPLSVGTSRFFPRRAALPVPSTWQVELEEAVRKGNEKFNTMITEQLMAQEDIRRAAEAEAKVTT